MCIFEMLISEPLNVRQNVQWKVHICHIYLNVTWKSYHFSSQGLKHTLICGVTQDSYYIRIIRLSEAAQQWALTVTGFKQPTRTLWSEGHAVCLAFMHDMLMHPDGASGKVRRWRAAAEFGWQENRRAERVGLRSSPRRQEAMFNWISVCILGW